MYALALALAATLSLGTPVPDGDGSRLVARDEIISRIDWRHSGHENNDPRLLVTCGSGPVMGYLNGDRVRLLPGYSAFCNGVWQVNNKTIVSGSARTGGPIRCLDSTLEPANGVLVQVWTCIEGAPQQEWEQHPDGRIELAGTGFCLDVPDGIAYKDLQLWECIPGNPNQEWDITKLGTVADNTLPFMRPAPTSRRPPPPTYS